MRAINHYRLDGDDPSIVASGHTVFDLGLARQIRRGVELNLSSRQSHQPRLLRNAELLRIPRYPTAPVVARIHATPGYPLTAVAGVTFRLRGK